MSTIPFLRRFPSDTGSATGTAQDWETHYIRHTGDALLALDIASGRVIGFNPAAGPLLGHAPDALMNRHFSELLPAQTANENTPVMRRFPLADTPSLQVFQHASGEKLLCDVRVTGLQEPRPLIVLHVREAGAREAEYQAQLAEARAAREADQSESIVRAVEQYMSHVSHELRTPLAVILSSSSMLERYYARLSEAKREEHFMRIQIQVKYLTEFLDNLRFLSRLDAGNIQMRPETIDITPTLAEILDEFAGYPSPPVFDVQVGGQLDDIELDINLWRRVLHAIIQNAVKYGPAGGVIHVRATRLGDHLQTQIWDDGAGLPLEYIPRAFQVFLRGENAANILGAGLGLAIASRCSALLGGTLSFEMLQPHGTLFTLTVPLA